MDKSKTLSFFINRNRAKLFFLGFLYLVYSVLETISIGSIYPLVNKIVSPDNGSSESFFIKFTEYLAGFIPVEEKIISAAVVLIALSIIATGFCIAVEAYTAVCKYNLYEKSFNEMFATLMRKKIHFFGKKKQGEIVYIGMTAAQAEGEIFHYLPKTMAELLKVMVLVVFLFTVSFKVSVLVFGFLFISGSIYALLAAKVIYPWAIIVRKESENIMSKLSEAILGITEVKLFNLISFLGKRYSLNTKRFNIYSRNSAIVNLVPNRLSLLVLTVAACGAIILIKKMYPDQFYNIISGITVYYMAMQKIFPAINNVGINWMGLRGLAPRLELIRETIMHEAEDDYSGTGKADSFRITSDDLCYSYPSKENVLKALNLNIEPSKMTAFVGPSGGGKSTIIKLLARLFEPSDGILKIGEKRIDELNLKIWRGDIALVPQEPFLFHLTVEENIRLGCLNASKIDVIEAAKKAYAHDFIVDLAEGYDTLLGERGAKLSGGQKQRIAIARALLRKPKLLLLDEATSALDNISERRIQEVLENLRGEMSIVVIAHRLSTIQNADLIYVIKDGAVVESGTHDELIKQNGEYQAIYLQKS